MADTAKGIEFLTNLSELETDLFMVRRTKPFAHFKICRVNLLLEAEKLDIGRYRF